MDLKIKEVEAAAAHLRADAEKENSKDLMLRKMEELIW